MEHGLGLLRLHVVALQGDVLDAAVLGEHQVGPRGQRLDVGAGSGSHGRLGTAVVDTWWRSAGK